MHKSALVAGSVVVAVVVSMLGCDPPPTPPPPSATKTATTTTGTTSAVVSASASVAATVASAVASGAAAASGSGSGSGHSAECEVEIFGTVDIPKDAPKGKAVVYVAQDDCMSDKAQTLGHIPVAPNGSFVIEVWPKWGTDVTICAALEKDDGTAEYYGKAVNKDNGGKFHAEAEGEVTFNEVKIPLKKGAPHKFPREQKAAGG